MFKFPTRLDKKKGNAAPAARQDDSATGAEMPPPAVQPHGAPHSKPGALKSKLRKPKLAF